MWRPTGRSCTLHPPSGLRAQDGGCSGQAAYRAKGACVWCDGPQGQPCAAGSPGANPAPQRKAVRCSWGPGSEGGAAGAPHGLPQALLPGHSSRPRTHNHTPPGSHVTTRIESHTQQQTHMQSHVQPHRCTHTITLTHLHTPAAHTQTPLGQKQMSLWSKPALPVFSSSEFPQKFKTMLRDKFGTTPGRAGSV